MRHHIREHHADPLTYITDCGQRFGPGYPPMGGWHTEDWHAVTCTECLAHQPLETTMSNRLSVTVQHDEATIDITISSVKHPSAVLLNALTVAANMAIKATTDEAETATIIAGDEAIEKFLASKEEEEEPRREHPHYTDGAFVCACCGLWSSGPYHVQGLAKDDELRFCTNQCLACSHKNPRH